jgi:hypothetical protein
MLFRGLSRLAAIAALGALGCSGTGNGGSGDPQSTPRADELGEGARIREVVGEAEWLNPDDLDSAACEVPPDKQTYVTGQVIVAIDRFDETGEGALGNIYIQDVYGEGEQPAAYSGMTVFDPAFTPPDLRIFDGDVMDTFGVLTEFLGPTAGPFGNCKTLPEISGTMAFRFEQGEPLVPITLVPKNGGPSRWDPLKGYANARQWLGMLIRVEGVIVAMPQESNGRYTAAIDVGGGITEADSIKLSNELFDLKNVDPPIAAGSQFGAVTGVLTYFYGFKIAPRSADDLEL